MAIVRNQPGTVHRVDLNVIKMELPSKPPTPVEKVESKNWADLVDSPTVGDRENEVIKV